MPRVLVVEDSPTQSLQIQILLEEAGFEVLLADNGVAALAVLKQGLPDIVLTDLDMPEMNGLELVEAIRRDYSEIPVILMTALGSEEVAVQALQKGAASYVPKRNLHEHIVTTLEDVLSVASGSRQEKRLLESMTRAGFEFVLENDVQLVAPLVEHLGGNLARMQLFDRTDLMRVGIALHEALVNAIQHGNLEVSSDLRQTDERNFRDLAEARRRQSPYRERRVQMSARLSAAECVFVVADEGPGYDRAALPDPNDPSQLERIGGRGLTLIRTFMDRVDHNARGNQITMTKRSRRAGK